MQESKQEVMEVVSLVKMEKIYQTPLRGAGVVSISEGSLALYLPINYVKH